MFKLGGTFLEGRLWLLLLKDALDRRKLITDHPSVLILTAVAFLTSSKSCVTSTVPLFISSISAPVRSSPLITFWKTLMYGAKYGATSLICWLSSALRS